MKELINPTSDQLTLYPRIISNSKQLTFNLI